MHTNKSSGILKERDKDFALTLPVHKSILHTYIPRILRIHKCFSAHSFTFAYYSLPSPTITMPAVPTRLPQTARYTTFPMSRVMSTEQRTLLYSKLRENCTDISAVIHTVRVVCYQTTAHAPVRFKDVKFHTYFFRGHRAVWDVPHDDHDLMQAVKVVYKGPTTTGNLPILQIVWHSNHPVHLTMDTWRSNRDTLDHMALMVARACPPAPSVTVSEHTGIEVEYVSDESSESSESDEPDESDEEGSMRRAHAAELSSLRAQLDDAQRLLRVYRGDREAVNDLTHTDLEGIERDVCKCMQVMMEARHSKKRRVDADCVVCRERYELTDMCVWPCGHVFCNGCTQRLMGINRVCAVCKAYVSHAGPGPVKMYGV